MELNNGKESTQRSQPGINHLAAMASNQSGQNQEFQDRIQELGKEWDEEQAIELSSAALGIAGTVLGILVHKRWFALPILAAAFLAQNSIQGWSPMVPLFRKFGFRKRAEIEKEKYALKAQRGDFRRTVNNPDKAWKAVNS